MVGVKEPWEESVEEDPGEKTYVRKKKGVRGGNRKAASNGYLEEKKAAEETQES